MAKTFTISKDFYPVPSFIKGSMLGKDDPVMVGEFWSPEIYEYVSDERMTDNMRMGFFTSCYAAQMEELAKTKEEGHA